ncbi:SDR family oxidoreductase [Halogeometricum sp. CBA1124]|uniref:SDR family oxidoreductase n=1 Tax=Halogeometricum sp. CBA1124 TaxID=2668071 RepID=UPI00142A26E0|nr:SDR family oxidoreductase [Halogeometricum sp. CBA1124]MUV56832.1 glucose 1-dehydrogenase [Halogeometricum sp. CBA1124]
MSPLLADRTAVVTGAASGNGRAIARTLAADGADVVVADIRETPREGGAPTHEIIRDETARDARFVKCDVTNRSDLEAAVDAADIFGGVDVMVNNAGILTDTPFLDISAEEFDRLLNVNVRGTFFGSQIAAERMIAGEGGAIVNVSSTLGLKGSGALAAYATTKGAVTLLTYSLGDALGDRGVRVNAVHPGTIETQMNVEDLDLLGTEAGTEARKTVPLDRFGKPEEIADAVAYLASDRASYVNATSLLVDGGEVNT